MELVGLCNICGRPGARHTCVLCGKLVCDNCYDPFHKVCIVCKRSKTL